MEEIKMLLEDSECTGYRCPHEISGKHYVMDSKDVESIIDLAVSKERERIVEKITKEWIPTKWEGYGGNIVKGMTLDDHKRNFSKEIINLINTK